MEGRRVREPEPDERGLVERARTGDMDAFEQLYRRYVARVHAFAYRRSGSRALADDVTSATFERALRSVGSFRWRDGGLAPWLLRIASNELADHHRAQARQDRLHVPGVDTTAAVEDDVLSALEAGRVRDALDRLNPRYQRAIALRYLSGLDHSEAARAMGTSRPVMAVLLHRAVGALRRELGAEQTAGGEVPA